MIDWDGTLVRVKTVHAWTRAGAQPECEPCEPPVSADSIQYPQTAPMQVSVSADST